MKAIEKHRIQKARETYSAVVVIVLLIILPHFGAIAMLVGCALAMCGYTFFFRELLRDRRGSLVPAICLTASLLLAALIVIILSLFH